VSSLAKTAKPRLGGKTLGRRIAENRQLCLLPVIPVVITIVYKYIIPPFFRTGYRSRLPEQTPRERSQTASAVGF